MDDIRDIVLFETADKNVMIDVALDEETVWLTKKQMVDLFERERTVISRHISNIFKESELEQKSNVHFLHVPNSDKPVEAYSLESGYRERASLLIRVYRRLAMKDG